MCITIELFGQTVNTTLCFQSKKIRQTGTDFYKTNKINYFYWHRMLGT